MVKAVHSAFRFWQRSIHVSSVLHQRPPTLAYPFLLRLTNSRGQWGFHTVSHTYLTCLFFLLFCIRTALLIICTKHQSNKICIENPLVLPLAWLFMYLINLIHQKRYVCVIKTRFVSASTIIILTPELSNVWRVRQDDETLILVFLLVSLSSVIVKHDIFQRLTLEPQIPQYVWTRHYWQTKSRNESLIVSP